LDLQINVYVGFPVDVLINTSVHEDVCKLR